MAMGTERSKPLHNFTLPCELRWGNQRFLRCMKVNSNGQISPLRRSTDNSYSPDQHRRSNSIQQPHRERGTKKDSSSQFVHGSHKVGLTTPSLASDGARKFRDDDDGIEAIREKVLLDLQTAADKMKDAIFKDGLDKGEVSGSLPPPPPASEEGQISRPWNLRTRRAACKTPLSRFVSSRNGYLVAAGDDNDSAGGKGLTADVLKPNSGSSQMRTGLAAVGDKSPTSRSGGTGAAATGEKRERPKFSVALSKGEIEEDFFAMVGHRPARRPKKRAKIIQRELDTLFPGLWLTEVTPDMYKVPEAAP
ncbi:hypothetical protein CDL12_01154 [Handroanthus impetiginosus]|uniref:DUF1639 domain-containing protein n=1 Tax=Handroanthus impetiginosus TaxID=429701 RepID=A0A2G9I8K5_9LAMI|nr:hypothetical protein CDL12_01154 [Handroanthus impetiginosus]